ncbi:MAG TPA: hypothetical protein VJX23_03170 [Candidatus Binataceae bacterium]|nr:hypothetical protein [Candidatus Binataceae bacterium]
MSIDAQHVFKSRDQVNVALGDAAKPAALAPIAKSAVDVKTTVKAPWLYFPGQRRIIFGHFLKSARYVNAGL